MNIAIAVFLVLAFVFFVIVRARGSGAVDDPHAPKAKAAPPAGGSPDGSVDDADVVSMIRQGNKIDAIRMYRELHGTDLSTAKDAVEELAKKLQP